MAPNRKRKIKRVTGVSGRFFKVTKDNNRRWGTEGLKKKPVYFKEEKKA